MAGGRLIVCYDIELNCIERKWVEFIINVTVDGSQQHTPVTQASYCDILRLCHKPMHTRHSWIWDPMPDKFHLGIVGMIFDNKPGDSGPGKYWNFSPFPVSQIRTIHWSHSTSHWTKLFKNASLSFVTKLRSGNLFPLIACGTSCYLAKRMFLWLIDYSNYKLDSTIFLLK